jgi:hypothetical protein
MSRSLNQITADLRVSVANRQIARAELAQLPPKADRSILDARVSILTERIETLLAEYSVIRFEQQLSAL